MKKQRVSPTTITPSVLKENFRATANELPSADVVNKAVEVLTGKEQEKAELETQIGIEIQKLNMGTKETEPVERNKRKRETAKGTVLQSVMIEKDLLKKAKQSALNNDISLSEVVNNAIRQYLQ